LFGNSKGTKTAVGEFINNGKSFLLHIFSKIAKFNNLKKEIQKFIFNVKQKISNMNCERYLFIYLLRCTFAYSVPIAFGVYVCHGGTLVHRIKGQEMHLCTPFSSLYQAAVYNNVPIILMLFIIINSFICLSREPRTMLKSQYEFPARNY
jgi:hypothetical protein